MSDAVVVSPMNKDRLMDIANRLRGAVYSRARAKHTPYLIARKEVVLPLVNELDSIVSSLPVDGTKSCSECPLWMREEDMRVARETVERLRRGSKEVTNDEAENLYNIILENYTKKS